MAKRSMPINQEHKSEQTKPVDDTPEVEPTKKDELIVLTVANLAPGQNLNLREKPDRNSKILTTLKVGTILVIDEMVDDWFHVKEFGVKDKKDPDSRPGYVLAPYTSSED